MRVLDLWSYCSMGRLEELDSTDFLGPFFDRATKIPRRRKRMLGAGDNLSRLITCQGTDGGEHVEEESRYGVRSGVKSFGESMVEIL
jgi:hypothetical protein